MTRRRQKRNLFNVIGQISKSLFGTAEDREVKVIREILKRNRERSGRIIYVVDKMTTSVNKIRGYVAKNRNHIKSLELFMKIFTLIFTKMKDF